MILISPQSTPGNAISSPPPPIANLSPTPTSTQAGGTDTVTTTPSSSEAPPTAPTKTYAPAPTAYPLKVSPPSVLNSINHLSMVFLLIMTLSATIATLMARTAVTARDNIHLLKNIIKLLFFFNLKKNKKN